MLWRLWLPRNSHGAKEAAGHLPPRIRSEGVYGSHDAYQEDQQCAGLISSVSGGVNPAGVVRRAVGTGTDVGIPVQLMEEFAFWEEDWYNLCQLPGRLAQMARAHA